MIDDAKHANSFLNPHRCSIVEPYIHNYFEVFGTLSGSSVHVWNNTMYVWELDLLWLEVRQKRRHWCCLRISNGFVILVFEPGGWTLYFSGF